MAREIVWNKKAIIKFEKIIDYLTEEVSEKAAMKFAIKVDDLISK